jgi:hypothetical protein
MHRRAWLVFAAALALLAWDVNDELLRAARNGDLAAVKAQLEKGAVLETKTPYGQTPLYLAAMNGHEEVVQLLLEKGANADVRDTFYKLPMFGFVLMRKHYGVAKRLIAKGAGTPDENLAAVAGTGNLDLVQAVLDKSKPSQSALDKTYEVALDGKNAEMAELLKKAGARPPAPAVEVDPKILESYGGTYRSEQFPLDIKVFVKEGKLYMQATGQSEFMPKAKSATAFEFAPAQMEVEFSSASSFMLKQRGMSIAYRKVVKP